MKYSEVVINAFATYTKTVDLIQATGLSKGTICKYKRDSELMKLAQERRNQVVKEAVYKMQSELTKSVDVLVSIRDNEDVNAQTRAYVCNLLLNHCRDWTLSVDILERVEALEKAGDNT